MSLLNKNRFKFWWKDKEIKIWYTEDQFYALRGLINEGVITNENIPLSVFDQSEIDVAIDVGAHIGIYSVILAKLNPTCDIYCFEPNKNNRRVLNRFLEINDVTAVIRKEIVSGKSGESDFYIDPSSRSQRHSTTSVEGFKKEKHTTISLSEFLNNKQINSVFIKIDAEGEEESIVPDLVKSDIDSVAGIVEFHPDKMSKPVDDILSQFPENGWNHRFVSESVQSSKNSRPIYYFHN